MMATELVHVLNPATGKVGELSRRLFRIPSIGGNLVEVPAGTKDYDPEFYKPKSKDSFVATHPEKTVKAKAEKPVVDSDPTKKENG